MKKIISFEKRLDFPSMIGEVTSISLDHNLKFVDESNIEGEFTISGSYKLTEASRLEEEFNFKIPADIILTEKLDLETTKIDIDDFYYKLASNDTMTCYIDVKIEGVEIIEDVEEVRKIEETEDSLQEENKRVEPEEIEIPQTQEENIEEEQEKIQETIEEEVKEKQEQVFESEQEEEKEFRECDGDLINSEQKEEERPKKEMENQKMNELEEYQENTTKKQEKEDNIQKEMENYSDEEKKQQSVGSLFTALKDSEETFSSYSVYILQQEETVQSLIEKYKTTKEDLENYNDLSTLTAGTKIIIPVSTNE